MYEVEPGDTLYGFCDGHFGRDSYGDKTVLATGRDWVVARENGRPVFSTADPRTLARFLISDDER